MLLKIYSLLLLLVPFLSYSQPSSNWKLYSNQALIASSTGDSVQTVYIQKRDTGDLSFVFTKGDTNFTRKIIVMDTQRAGIDSKNITANTCEAVFDIGELFKAANGKDLTFYIITIPADPKKAALVRVAPYPICNLQWKE